MKKNIIITLLAIISVGAITALIITSKGQNEKSDQPEPPKVENDNSNKENSEANDEKKEEIQYKHVTEAKISLWQDEKEQIITLKVENGKLVSSPNIEITGLNGEIKYFMNDTDCEGTTDIIVLTNANKAYYTSIERDQKNINFKEIKTTENILDITKYFSPDLTTCDGTNLGVVTKENKVYPVIVSQGEYQLMNKDFSIYKDTYGSLIIYTDDTVSTNGEVGYDKFTKLTFNNQEITVKNIFSGNEKDENNYNYVYYIISKDNKLYRVELKLEDWERGINLNKVELLKQGKVKKFKNEYDTLKITWENDEEVSYKISGNMYFNENN